jgi:hypothetical protein
MLIFCMKAYNLLVAKKAVQNMIVYYKSVQQHEFMLSLILEFSFK